MIRPAGFFIELSPGWGLPLSGSIKDAVNSTGEPDEKNFVTYLRNGTGIWSEMSAGHDVLDPEAPILTGIGSLYTDGDWIWREDLAHYVTKYHVSLPAEFVTHIRALNYRTPDVPETKLIEILTQDLGITMD
ncbi:hypothetical protein PV396_20185 [Streptomyces sp. ME02-8801-2C]|uniref:hypothetical protein n=1 Tax=Streptomyces sp. ME02-8801-2C TaxID=3028680 RepID=UPI0029A3C6D9|nr:hypothetical protein [Streptomyces sp. ME02-8801-2C]MDX3454236.1 hypothetical protein [Streptomyces sp. ME02-8801-2C]